MFKTRNDFIDNHYTKVNFKTFTKLRSNLSTDFAHLCENSKIHLQLGICYYKNGEIQRAKTQFNIAVKKDSENFVALYWLALIQYKKLKDFENAVLTFQKVLKFRFSNRNVRYYYTGNPKSIFHKSTNYIIYLTFNKLL